MTDLFLLGLTAGLALLTFGLAKLLEHI